jgi:ATP-dependent Clp protease adaptor protein ClpS
MLTFDMATERTHAPEKEGGVATTAKLAEPQRYAVVFHNDDYTTRDFVVHVLMKFFQHGVTEATHIMLSVHHRGSGVAGTFSRDLAETKALQVTEYARRHEMPLKVTAEPEGPRA